MGAPTIEIHDVFAARLHGSTDAALAGVMAADGPRRPSLGTLLQNHVLADAARHEPRLYLLFATAQRHAGRPYAERVATAAELKQQAHALAGWFVVLGRPGSAAQLAVVCHTIDRLLLLAGHPTDHAPEPIGDVPS